MRLSIDDDKLTATERRRVKKLRQARSAARKDARSGHPGRRAQGQRAIVLATALIARTYLEAAAR